MEYLIKLFNTEFKILLIFTLLDCIFGCLRAFKDKKINSTIGINGLIRKVGMFISVLFFNIIDKMIKINLIGFIPDQILNYLPIQEIGIGGIFCLLFILFEVLSVLKNMRLCELPLPKFIQGKLEQLLKEWTNEIKEQENEKF